MSDCKIVSRKAWKMPVPARSGLKATRTLYKCTDTLGAAFDDVMASSDDGSYRIILTVEFLVQVDPVSHQSMRERCLTRVRQSQGIFWVRLSVRTKKERNTRPRVLLQSPAVQYMLVSK